MVNKITPQELHDNGISSVEGARFPDDYTLSQVKAAFDKLPSFIANRLNAVLDMLYSVAGGNNSGADKIGSAPVSGVSGANVRAQIASLKAIIDGLVLDEAVIPDGSLVRAKFANWSSDVMAALLAGYSLPIESGDLSSLDTAVQALGKLERALKNLKASTDNIISGTTTVPKAANVTSQINGVNLDQIFENDGISVKYLSESALLQAHPVGSIFITTIPANPGTYFGGTWAAFGEGQVIVGVDTSQAEFNAVEKTGGAKTHQLTKAEMPRHQHSFYYPSDEAQFQKLLSSGTQQGAITNTTGAAGDDVPHNNLQPYITCYMWKRTA